LIALRKAVELTHEIMFSLEKSILKHLAFNNCSNKSTILHVKRDDLIDPIVSGNKWRKLKYNILAAQSRKNDTLITFGGAYSNHLIATAKACALYGIESVGIVRGEELHSDSNETLKHCRELGMKLMFISREEYHLRNDKTYWEQLHIDYPNSFIVPEGGANFYGLIGCQEIWKELSDDYTDVIVSAGTGTTAAGILSGMPEKCKLHVFSALKGDFMEKEILSKIEYGFHNSEFTDQCASRLQVYSEDIFGGYGKFNIELLRFIQEMNEAYDLPLDQVYTGKAFFRLVQLINENYFSENAKILFIHTGGLQGNTAKIG
jgi:1-aminocyclopropane-1-carboxylate deaminase